MTIDIINFEDVRPRSITLFRRLIKVLFGICIVLTCVPEEAEFLVSSTDDIRHHRTSVKADSDIQVTLGWFLLVNQRRLLKQSGNLR